MTPLFGKIPVLLLLCAMLAACSTTQKSSTATQDAAPISEAGQTDTGKPADAATSSSGTASSVQGAQSGAGGSPDASGAAAVAGKGDEEAARLKQQLAEQEAEINRVRQEQVDAQRLADEEAARRRAAEAAASSSTDSAAQQDSQASSAPGTSGGAAGAGAGSQAGSAQAGSSDAPAAGQPLQRSIYFEFDNASIPEQYDSMIVGHANFLRAHPDFSAEIQGNCDERGSREYNLALGARRAEAVKKALELSGADGSKIKTVSFGAEKPVAFGQDEESYKQNRRADIQY
jgi:peptidoglycan-associated lipoprotein